MSCSFHGIAKCFCPYITCIDTEIKIVMKGKKLKLNAA